MTETVLDRVRGTVAPVAAGAVARVPPLPAAVVGAVLLVVGSLSPWATFGGFPGKMSLAGFPGGARQFTLLLAAAVVLVVVRLPGRRRAGLTAAVLGGIGNVSGAMLGGFVLGMVEVMAVQYIPHGSAWRDAWAFAVLILVLVFRPAGLLGERVGARS